MLHGAIYTPWTMVQGQEVFLKMKIGELSRRTRVSTDTLRLYEKRGLIRSERMANGYRDFDRETERFVDLIRLGQRLGFTLSGMKEIVVAMAGQQLSTGETTKILQEKFDEVDEKIGELVELKKVLAELMAQTCPLQN